MSPVVEGTLFGVGAAVLQAQGSDLQMMNDLPGLVTTGGTIGALVWFLKYATSRWEKLDERHETLHQRTLQVVENSSRAISENTSALKQMKSEIRLCQFVRPGNVDKAREAMQNDDTPLSR